jgi:hypothetical protein
MSSVALPEDHAHLVGLTIIHERNSGGTVGKRLAVQLGFSNSTADPMGVLDGDLVVRRVIFEDDLEPRPLLGYAGGEEQERSV